MSFDLDRPFPGAQFEADERRSTLVLSSSSGKPDGSLVTYYLAPGLVVYGIDIHSQTIPGFLSADREGAAPLKINCCQRGRCELELHTGEYIYLAGGELSVDTGQAKAAYYFPSAEYRGIEIIADFQCVENRQLDLFGTRLDALRNIYDRCVSSAYPYIEQMDDAIASVALRVFDAISERCDYRIVAARVMELLVLLERIPALASMRTRSYCTASQVEIAKRVYEYLAADLTRRTSARALAAQYGISETSLKNYFRNVYGVGFAEFQKNLRMEHAADMLANSSAKVSEVAASVGYASQPKFCVAFKEHFGQTPLEYRRNAVLSMSVYQGIYQGTGD